MNEPDAPELRYQVGYCTNLDGKGRIGEKHPCQTPIFSDDIEAVRLPNGWCCGKCVDDLLFRQPIISHEDISCSNMSTKVRWAKGINISRGHKPPPRGKQQQPTRSERLIKCELAGHNLNDRGMCQTCKSA
jgi:hypothetical protein